MLSKHNFKERLRKMEDKQDRFSIRKFSIGAVSVLIGSFIFGIQSPQTAKAETLSEKIILLLHVIKKSQRKI